MLWWSVVINIFHHKHKVKNADHPTETGKIVFTNYKQPFPTQKDQGEGDIEMRCDQQQ